MKMRRPKKRFGVRVLLLLVACALMLAGVLGSTMAWLVAKTDKVVNTFTYGDIDITLTETDPEGNDDPSDNTFSMVPGNDITKDPKVTVLKDSEACWLFVKIEKSDNLDDFITYAVADGWTVLDATNHPGVYYREVSKSDTDQTFSVLAGDKVTVKSSVTKGMLNALDTNSTYPTMTFTAYAVQHDFKLDGGAVSANALDAWGLIGAQTGA